MLPFESETTRDVHQGLETKIDRFEMLMMKWFAALVGLSLGVSGFSVDRTVAWRSGSSAVVRARIIRVPKTFARSSSVIVASAASPFDELGTLATADALDSVAAIPGLLLAVPIVAAMLVGSFIAWFIVSSSQPEEDD